MNTQEKILDKALEMFNERGIEYVGLRELAAALGIRVGNITYYFPTKDDLVYQLSLELSKKNETVIAARENLTIATFFDMLHQVFQHHLEFRCLLLSIVHLMEQNKHIAATYKKTQNLRSHTIKQNLETLSNRGYLTIKEEAEMDFLVATLSLISRFWISEAAISFRNASYQKQINHYLGLVARLLLPYATSRAKKELQDYL